MRLRHAHRQLVEPQGVHLTHGRLSLCRVVYRCRAVDLLSDGLYLILRTHRPLVEWRKPARAALGSLDHYLTQVEGPLASLAPHIHHGHRYIQLAAHLFYAGEFLIGVRGEAIDRHHGARAEQLHVLHLLLQVADTLA